LLIEVLIYMNLTTNPMYNSLNIYNKQLYTLKKINHKDPVGPTSK